jgi:Domain of unknown function (DUF6532)
MIFLQIVGRASQARGHVKTTSKPYFISAYQIDSHASKRETRDSVEQLLEGARFIYKVNYCLFTIVLLLMVSSLRTGSLIKNRHISSTSYTNDYQQGLVQE